MGAEMGDQGAEVQAAAPSALRSVEQQEQVQAPQSTTRPLTAPRPLVISIDTPSRRTTSGKMSTWFSGNSLSVASTSFSSPKAGFDLSDPVSLSRATRARTERTFEQLEHARVEIQARLHQLLLGREAATPRTRSRPFTAGRVRRLRSSPEVCQGDTPGGGASSLSSGTTQSSAPTQGSSRHFPGASFSHSHHSTFTLGASPEVRGATVDVPHQRAITIGTLMACGARHFGSNVASEADHALSTPCTQYGYFISHSWAAARHHKCLALLYRFSLVPALVAAHAAALVATVLATHGVLPAFYVGPPWPTLGVESSQGVVLWAQALGAPTFILVLLAQEYLQAAAERLGVLAQSRCFLGACGA